MQVGVARGVRRRKSASSEARSSEERREAAPIPGSDPRLHPGRADVSSLQLLRRIPPVFGGDPG